MTHDDRRWRLYAVTPHEVLTAFVGWRRPDYLRLPLLELPEGASVAEVHYDAHGHCFLFRAAHPSFPPVPVGEEAPRARGTTEQVLIQGATLHALANISGQLDADGRPAAELLAECKRIVAAGKANPRLSEADRVRSALDAELDNGPRLALLAAADHEDDQGDNWAADGYRWLAGYGRWPGWEYRMEDRGRVAWRWSYQSWPDGQEWRLQPPHRLPEAACRRIPGWGRHQGWESPSPALRAAAVAVGAWLREEGAKEAEA